MSEIRHGCSGAIHLIYRNFRRNQTLFLQKGPIDFGPASLVNMRCVMMKSLTTLAVAGALAVAAVAAPAPAQAGNGGAVAAGVVGGLAAGAIIGSAVAPRYGYGYYGGPAAYGYYDGPYAYGGCHIVREKIWTNYGPRWRRVRVCN
jgi:hypothetical protein